MREWPDARVVSGLLARVTRRARLQAVVMGLAAGLVLAAVPVAVLLLNGAQARVAALAAGVLAVIGALVAWGRFDASEAVAAATIERRAPECRNLIITAAALLQSAGPTPLAICRVVAQDAAAVAGRLDPGRLLPWGRAAGRLAAAVALCAAAFLVRVPAVAGWLPDSVTEASSAPMVSGVRVTVTPPVYSGLAPASFSNPERVTARAGSRLDLEIRGSGAVVTVETADGVVPALRRGDDAFEATMAVTADGFVAMTPVDAVGGTGPRRLIGLTVLPDRPPVPRITLPGKDLFLREATAALGVTVTATDDLGLRSLRLTYTKVAGMGESFTFTEGEVPLTLTRTSAREWSGTGVLPLAALGLDVGDMVVYRAVAADTQPDARPVESDAFIVEIVSTNDALAEGFAIDDTTDKYALSQQMVIIKTERLMAKAAARPAPSAEAILEEAMTIAAEQRSVRAELVFMTGGHFEDEFVEAAHEHEITDGRLDNAGRADLARAIRDMSRASAELTQGNLLAALEAERSALEAMQRALSRRRFILRTLTQREAIDDSRRLTGTLSDLARARRAVSGAEVPPPVIALRGGLAHLAVLAEASTLTRDHAAALGGVIEELLRAGAGDPAIVDVVAGLSAAGEAMSAGREREARAALTAAASRMTALLRAAAPVSAAGDEAEARRLRGALADVRQRGGGR